MSVEIKILGNMTLVLSEKPNPGPVAFLDRREQLGEAASNHKCPFLLAGLFCVSLLQVRA